MSSINNSSNGLSGHREMFGESCECAMSRDVHRPNKFHLGNSQFSARIFAPDQSASTMPFFFITHIVLMCPKIKMAWIHALGVVTSMANVHSFWNWCRMRQYPSESMRIPNPPASSEPSVPPYVSIADPSPAVGSFVSLHLSPKCEELFFCKLDVCAGIRDLLCSFFHSSFMIEVRARLAGRTASALAYFNPFISVFQPEGLYL